VRGVLEDLPKSVLIGAPLLGLLLLLTLVFQDQINRFFEAPVTNDFPQLPAEVNQSVVPLKLPEESVKGSKLHSEEEKVSADKSDVLLTEDQPKRMEIPISLPTVSAPESTPVVDDPAESSVPESADLPISKEDGAAKADLIGGKGVVAGISVSESESPSVPVAAVPPVKSAEVTALPLEKEPKVAEVTPPSVKVAPPKVVEAVKIDTSPPTKPPAPVKETAFKGRVWLLRRNPSRYTLQLIGVQDEGAAKQFISHHGITDEAAYFKTLRDNKPWFSVVYGVYSGRNGALEAKKALPGNLKNGSSWPRSFGSIQKALPR